MLSSSLFYAPGSQISDMVCYLLNSSQTQVREILLFHALFTHTVCRLYLKSVHLKHYNMYSITSSRIYVIDCLLLLTITKH